MSTTDTLFETDGPLAVLTFNRPQARNAMTWAMYQALVDACEEVDARSEILVFILRGAGGQAFVAGTDIEQFKAFASPGDGVAYERRLDEVLDRLERVGKPTIAQIEGRVGGGGCELIQAFDMRFGVLGKTTINQMEVPIGILPGGGGTQRLPRLVGRGRALEIILGGEDLDAETAERWGLLNRALAADEIGTFVEALAHRIASFPAAALELAKQSVNAAELPLAEGLVEEAYLFQRLLRTQDAQRNMRRFLELGGQTREGELEVAELSARANRED